jgi:hypothetical protein
VHHRLDASLDRAEPSQPQQVQCGGSQRDHHAGAIAPVAVGVLTDLGVANPVPVLDTPAVPHQLQQGFWRCLQKQVSGLKRLAVTGAADHDFHDPAGADPGLADVLWNLSGP